MATTDTIDIITAATTIVIVAGVNDFVDGLVSGIMAMCDTSQEIVPGAFLVGREEGGTQML